jgi:hypothetical protein
MKAKLCWKGATFWSIPRLQGGLQMFRCYDRDAYEPQLYAMAEWSGSMDSSSTISVRECFLGAFTWQGNR